MNSNQKQFVKEQLAVIEPRDRKRILAEAAERRTQAQAKPGKPAGDMDFWVYQILQERQNADLSGPFVVSAHATHCDVEVGSGIQTLPIRHAVRPVVGDYVQIDQGRIVKVLPRKTSLAKPDPDHGGREVVFVANIDVVVVVLAAANPPLHPRIIDRYLMGIRRGGAEALIVVNKLDLLDELGYSQMLAKLQPYRDAGLTVVETSTETGKGLDEVQTVLSGRRCVFVGHSGVGKSSLLNALTRGTTTLTGQVNTKTGKGKHTTTASTFYRLPSGIEVIDTPGVRSFGIADDADLSDGFPEFAGYTCKFSDCQHIAEDRCGVREAVRTGLISRERYIAYRRLVSGDPVTGEGFVCSHCGSPASELGGGTKHRNHCPKCLWSLHVDSKPGDRAACCGAPMEPVAVWVRKDGEWAIIHRCTQCGTMSSNRIAADDNEMLLLSIAAKPLARPPFPLDQAAQGEPVG